VVAALLEATGVSAAAIPGYWMCPVSDCAYTCPLSEEPNCPTHGDSKPKPVAPAETSKKPNLSALRAAKKPPRNEALVRRACLEIIENKNAPYREKLRAASLLAGLVKLGKAKPRGKAVKGRSDVTKGNIRELLSEAASSPSVRHET
jgi:hypothetical protein